MRESRPMNPPPPPPPPGPPRPPPARTPAPPAASQARALIEHRLDHLLAVRLRQEDEPRLAVLVRVEECVRAVLLQAGDVVTDLAVGVQHHVPQEHVRLGIDGLPVRVVLGEALDEPERE